MFGQRIALSWMVQKETSSVPCAGGILADDQVSTLRICLISRGNLNFIFPSVLTR